MQRGQIWVGAEPLRRHHVRSALSGDELNVDCAGPDGAVAALQAVRGGGLFTSAVRLLNLDALSVPELTGVAAAVEAGGGPVIAECEKLGAPAKRALAHTFDVHQVSIGRAAGRRTLQDIARLLGLQLNGPCADLIAGRCEGDPGRAVGTLEALAAGGFQEPIRAQVELLLGTAGSPGMPWTLLEHLERGRTEHVAELIGQVEAIPALGFLSKRVLVAMLTAEDPDLSDEELDSILGGVTTAASAGARRLGRRVGVTGCRRLLTVLAEADVYAKRGHPDAAMLLAVGHLALEMSPGDQQTEL
jgi:hypothetical protein